MSHHRAAAIRPCAPPVCDLFGVRYPIVQTGMGWVSTPELTAATANAGGLGILASGDAHASPRPRRRSRATRELTDGAVRREPARRLAGRGRARASC